MKRLCLMVTMSILLLLTGCTSSLSEGEVKEIVKGELEAHFNYEFGVENVGYNAMNDSYEFDAYLLKDKEATFNLMLSGDALKNGESGIDSKAHLYRGVVSGLYRRDLKNIMNNALEKNVSNYKIAHLDYRKPKMIDFKDDAFVDMDFDEFSKVYQDELLYKAIVLVPENFHKKYLQENEMRIKDFMRDLENNHVKNINLVFVFANDTAAYSNIQDIEKLLSAPLKEGFRVEDDKKPVIPGMNYEEWKSSLIDE
jgi:hypothetical protein